MRNVAICCSVGRVAADGVWLLFYVMWCGVTAVSDGYGDQTAFEMWLFAVKMACPFLLSYLHNYVLTYCMQ